MNAYRNEHKKRYLGVFLFSALSWNEFVVRDRYRCSDATRIFSRGGLDTYNNNEDNLIEE